MKLLTDKQMNEEVKGYDVNKHKSRIKITKHDKRVTKRSGRKPDYHRKNKTIEAKNSQLSNDLEGMKK